MTFSAYVILHAIGRAQQKIDLVEYGANTVLARFNEFLTEENEHGTQSWIEWGRTLSPTQETSSSGGSRSPEPLQTDASIGSFRLVSRAMALRISPLWRA